MPWRTQLGEAASAPARSAARGAWTPAALLVAVLSTGARGRSSSPRVCSEPRRGPCRTAAKVSSGNCLFFTVSSRPGLSCLSTSFRWHPQTRRPPARCRHLCNARGSPRGPQRQRPGRKRESRAAADQGSTQSAGPKAGRGALGPGAGTCGGRGGGARRRGQSCSSESPCGADRPSSPPRRPGRPGSSLGLKLSRHFRAPIPSGRGLWPFVASLGRQQPAAWAIHQPAGTRDVRLLPGEAPFRAPPTAPGSPHPGPAPASLGSRPLSRLYLPPPQFPLWIPHPRPYSSWQVSPPPGLSPRSLVPGPALQPGREAAGLERAGKGRRATLQPPQTERAASECRSSGDPSGALRTPGREEPPPAPRPPPLLAFFAGLSCTHTTPAQRWAAEPGMV